LGRLGGPSGKERTFREALSVNDLKSAHSTIPAEEVVLSIVRWKDRVYNGQPRTAPIASTIVETSRDIESSRTSTIDILVAENIGRPVNYSKSSRVIIKGCTDR